MGQPRDTTRDVRETAAKCVGLSRDHEGGGGLGKKGL